VAVGRIWEVVLVASKQSGSFEYRQQDVASASVRLKLTEETTPTGLWTTLVESDGFQSDLAAAVRSLTEGLSHGDRVDALVDVGVTAGELGYARCLVGFERGPTSDAYQRAVAVTKKFGTGILTPFGHQLRWGDLQSGPLPVFNAVGKSPILRFQLTESFKECRRDQREEICRLLSRLASACRVNVVGTHPLISWLAKTHASELPATFSERSNRNQSNSPVITSCVEEALRQFDRDGRAVNILRTISEMPGDSISYHELTSSYSVSDGRISQILGDLEDAGLIERYGSTQNRHVDLLPAGQAFVSTLDEHIQRESKAEEKISEAGQPSHSDVLARPHKKPPTAPSMDEDPDRTSPQYRTRYLSRPLQAAIPALVSCDDVVAAESSHVDLNPTERRTRYVSYSESRDEAIISVYATTPLQYAASTAIGLASPRFLDKALPKSRLEDLDQSAAMLRSAKCIGGLSAEAADDLETLRENLIEWGEDLEEMTYRLSQEEYDDRDRFVGEILRSAHGLAGSIVHLVDAADIDLIREIRAPSLTDHQMCSLSRTIATSMAIQSEYRSYATYPQLFETREDVRADAWSVDVDADDPVGSFIGSLVIRGPSAERLGTHLEGTLEDGRSVHEDAPEFAISLSVGTPGREAYTAAINRMTKRKNIRATPTAVTLFKSLAEDVYAVAESLQWLGAEDTPRTIHFDEVRASIAQLDPDRLLTDGPPSLAKALSTLLQTPQLLSQAEIADRSDISKRSLRRHFDALLALDLVREIDSKYRIVLPSDGDDSRNSPIPDVVEDDNDASDIVFDLTLALIDVEEAHRVGDPADPLGKPFCGAVFDPGGLSECPTVAPYLTLALSLSGYETARTETLSFGAEIQQTSIQDALT
jgi:DNA-binding MarR family transcriptional regulator